MYPNFCEYADIGSCADFVEESGYFIVVPVEAAKKVDLQLRELKDALSGGGELAPVLVRAALMRLEAALVDARII